MCNACGFLCCAWDGFAACGCEWCDEPACWPDEEDDDWVDDDYDLRGGEAGRGPAHAGRLGPVPMPGRPARF